MSATNAPFGFIASKHPSGFCRADEYTIASGYAANIFQGDPVKLVTAGTIQLGTSDGTRTGTVAGISLIGIFAGVTYTDAQNKPNFSNFWPTGQVATDIKAMVYDDPDTDFTVQADGSVAAAGLGDQADWSGFAAPGGSTTTGRSLGTLSATLKGAGNQGQFRITEFDRSPDNSAGDSFTKVVVQVAQHQYRADKTAV